jgi:hypothetical protein
MWELWNSALHVPRGRDPAYELKRPEDGVLQCQVADILNNFLFHETSPVGRSAVKERNSSLMAVVILRILFGAILSLCCISMYALAEKSLGALAGRQVTSTGILDLIHHLTMFFSKNYPGTNFLLGVYIEHCSGRAPTRAAGQQ